MSLVSCNFSNSIVAATNIGKSIHFWGAKLKQGYFFTSYLSTTELLRPLEILLHVAYVGVIGLYTQKMRFQ